MLLIGQKQTILLWLLFVALLAVGLTACGEDGASSSGGEAGAAASDNSGSAGSGSASGEVPDACSLLATDEVDTAVGGTTTPQGEVTEDGQFSICTWSDDTSGAFLIISIWSRGTAGDEWTKMFLATQVPVGEAEAVSNLGEEAYLKADDELMNVYWRKGSEYVIVLTAGAGPEAEDDIINLGRKVDSGF